jgi:hypothetical protein
MNSCIQDMESSSGVVSAFWLFYSNVTAFLTISSEEVHYATVYMTWDNRFKIECRHFD